MNDLRTLPLERAQPAATRRAAWMYHNMRYGDTTRVTEASDQLPSTSVAGLLKRFSTGGSNGGCLVIVLVILGLCVFVWAVAAATLTHYVIFAGENPDRLRYEDADEAVELHLEENYVPNSPTGLKVSPEAGTVVQPWRPKAAQTLRGANGVAVEATNPSGDELGGLLGVHGHDSSGREAREGVPVHPSYDAEATRRSDSVSNVSEPEIIL
ncbi:uncharacterized protein LOC144123312 [Amblyomma americanum]